MADNAPVDASAEWLAVIGKALAYLCLQEAQRNSPEKFDTVLKQVKFLQGLGLSRKDAAETAGSSAESVRVMQHKRKSTRVKKNATAKKRPRR
jgi:antitoxin component HigA of HigAB toxin-antitoxin module